MDVGVFYFPTDYGINVAELGRALEDRGFGSLYVPEHTHIPLSRKTPASVAPTLVVHQPEPSRLARWAAVVEMVSVVEPLPVTEAGLKLHVASLGNPVHDVAEKSTVPL